VPTKRAPYGAGGRVTIADVARTAGVSRATVSRVLNGRATVDPVLAERVRRVSRRLGYYPSAIAQGLARGASHTIGVVVPDLANPFFPEVVKALTVAAGEDGFSVVVADSDEDSEAELRLIQDLSRRVDGLVLCSPRAGIADLRRVVRKGLPTVCTNRMVDPPLTASVVIDSGRGMQAVLEHLAGLGHRRIAYLAGPPSSSSNADRLGALERGLPGAVVVPTGSKSPEGYASAAAAVEAGATAIVCFNDLVAFGALARLRTLGVAVPGEVSVVGFDDIPAADFIHPALTTVRLPKAELGRRSWEVLRDQLGDREVSASVRLEPTLVVRQSTGKAVAVAGDAETGESTEAGDAAAVGKVAPDTITREPATS
jgi:LacI family transcriptional regulator